MFEIPGLQPFSRLSLNGQEQSNSEVTDCGRPMVLSDPERSLTMGYTTRSTAAQPQT
jgi:hypothetical protein